MNHKAQDVGHILQSGDQVEVMTDAQQEPKPEWINMVVTAKAQAAIHRYFKRIEIMGGNGNTVAFPAWVHVRGKDQFGVLIQVIRLISEKMHLNMKSMHVDSDDSWFDCNVEVMVFSDQAVELLLKELRKVPELVVVERSVKSVK